MLGPADIGRTVSNKSKGGGAGLGVARQTGNWIPGNLVLQKPTSWPNIRQRLL